MSSTNSKKFYLMCVKEGIKAPDGREAVARMMLAAQNNGFSGTEEELVKMYYEGERLVSQEKTEGENQKVRAEQEKVIQQEKNKIAWDRHIAAQSGNQKPVAMLSGQIQSLKKAEKFYEKKAEEQAKTEAATSFVKMAADARRKSWELQNQMEAQKKRLAEKLSPVDLLVMLSPELVKYEHTQTGAIKLTAKVQPTPDVKIYENVKAVVDGTFKALLLDEYDQIAGEVLFVLPLGGAEKEECLEGICNSTADKSKEYKVVFVPCNLCAIETDRPIAAASTDAMAQSRDEITYYIIKDSLKKESDGKEKYEKAISGLEKINCGDKGDALKAYCKEMLEEIIKKEDEAKRQKRRVKRNIIIWTSAILLVAAAVTAFILMYNSPMGKHKRGMALMDKGMLQEAYDIFCENIDYEQSREQLEKFEIVYDERVTECSDGSKTVETYDENFNLIKSVYTGKDGNKNVRTYEYDKNNNLLRKEYTDSYGDKNVRTYEYDKNNNLLREEYTDSDGDKFIWVYEYDKMGNVLREEYTDSDGYKSVEVYEYNENNDILRYELTNSNGINYVNENKYEYEYDKAGNVLRKELINEDGDKWIEKYEYDEAGNILMFEETNWDGETQTEKYEYDENNNLLSYVASDPYAGPTIEKYKYDEKGNILRHEKEEWGEDKIIEVYEYDKIGNMLSHIIYEKDVAEANITYKELWTYGNDGMCIKYEETDKEETKTETYTYNGKRVVLKKDDAAAEE